MAKELSTLSELGLARCVRHHLSKQLLDTLLAWDQPLARAGV